MKNDTLQAIEINANVPVVDCYAYNPVFVPPVGEDTDQGKRVQLHYKYIFVPVGEDTGRGRKETILCVKYTFVPFGGDTDQGRK